MTISQEATVRLCLYSQWEMEAAPLVSCFNYQDVPRSNLLYPCSESQHPRSLQWSETAARNPNVIWSSQQRDPTAQGSKTFQPPWFPTHTGKKKNFLKTSRKTTWSTWKKIQVNAKIRYLCVFLQKAHLPSSRGSLVTSSIYFLSPKFCQHFKVRAFFMQGPVAGQGQGLNRK